MSVEILPQCPGPGCNNRLEPRSGGRGRRRKWCSEACRSRAKRDRASLPVWESIAGEFADASVVDPLTRRREMVEAVAGLLEGEPAAPAIDRAAQFLVEIRGAAWAARRLEAELPPRLAARFGSLATAIHDALERSFGEVVNL